jgi:hypothetical protein
LEIERKEKKKNKGNRRMQEPVKMRLTNDDSNASGRVTDCVVRGRERERYISLSFFFIPSSFPPLYLVRGQAKNWLYYLTFYRAKKRNGKK